METKKKAAGLGETGNGGGSNSAAQKSSSRSHLFTSENRPKGGRPAGVPNKLTKTFKAAAEEAFSTFEDEGKNIKGGVQWLQSMMRGTSSDRAAVLQLYGRLIPAQLQGEVNHSVKVQLSFASGRNLVPIEQKDMHSAGNYLEHDKNQDVIDVDDISVGSRCGEGVENGTNEAIGHGSLPNQEKTP